MDPLNCQQARGHFSEDLDGRLAAEPKLALRQHVEACAACAETLRGYRTMQSSARRLLASDVVVPPLVLAQPHTVRWSFSQWRTGAAAALVLVLCSLAAFQLGRDSQPTSAGVQPATPVLAAGLFPQRLKDHNEAAVLLGRQIMAMPPEAGEEADLLLDKQLCLLDAEILESQSQRSSWCADLPEASATREYLREWRACSRALRQQLEQGGHTVGNLQAVVGASRFWAAAGSLSELTASIPHGVWFTSNEGHKALKQACQSEMAEKSTMPAQGRASQDVSRFMQAHANLLQAHPAEARAGFARLRVQQSNGTQPPHTSRIEQLARYMEAECLRRCGQVGASSLVMLSGEALILPGEHIDRLRDDPVIGPIIFVQQGSVSAPMPVKVGMIMVDFGTLLNTRIQPQNMRVRVRWTRSGQCGDCGEQR